MRQDYIEPDYVNGVYSGGELVIRALNEEEKDFLNKFYEEVIGANFIHDKEIKKLNRQIRELKKKKVMTREDDELLMDLQMEYYMLTDEKLLYPDEKDQRKIYGENNARNRCLFNRTKSICMLDELNCETYDTFHESVYNNPDSGEMAVINTIEPKIKTILRKKKS